MRNASDIFCLNEEVTDGTQMFSVNGSCPLKIRRRTQPRENECFEYGRCTTSEELDRGDTRSEKLDLENLEKSDDPEKPVDELGGKEPETLKELETPKEPETPRESGCNKNNSNEKHTPISSSNMQRNPLTGAGMEIEQHKKSKKGQGFRGDKWMW
ncbi:uncharacterized protein [Leptinotarsa decemlineata]|uniref:uncharacterized protein n=1 Tax=Leptinotarsa decemlineata TaxID=7539 RepID=UPI003D30D688